MKKVKSCKVNRNTELEETATGFFNENPLVTSGFRVCIILAAIYLSKHYEIVQSLLQPDRLYYPAYITGTASGILALGCVMLVIIWKHVVQRGTTYRHFRMRARRPLMAIVVSGSVSLWAYVVAFWPLLGHKGIFLFAFFAYSSLCALSFV